MIDIRSEIAPKGLEFKPSEFIISDKYACILTAISYPKFIPPGYLSSLTSMSGVKVVIKHIPLPASTMSKMLNKELADLFPDLHDKIIAINDRVVDLLDPFESLLVEAFQQSYRAHPTCR